MYSGLQGSGIKARCSTKAFAVLHQTPGHAVMSAPVEDMRISEQNEAFVEGDGNLVFHHTKTILKQNNSFFYASSDRRRLHASSPIDIAPSDLTDKVWPEFDGSRFIRAPEPLPRNSYVKRPSLITRLRPYDGVARARRPAAGRGGRVRDFARARPIQTLRGTWAASSKTAGSKVCVSTDRYPTTLRQGIEDPRPLDVGKCLRGIEDGVNNHLHALGLVHNYLNPSNIMMDGGDNPVVIDF